MPARKYSASMDTDLLADVETFAAEDGVTVSAWIAKAVEDRVALLGLRRLIDDWQAEHGEFTEEERAASRRRAAEATATPPASVLARREREGREQGERDEQTRREAS